MLVNTNSFTLNIYNISSSTFNSIRDYFWRQLKISSLMASSVEEANPSMLVANCFMLPFDTEKYNDNILGLKTTSDFYLGSRNIAKSDDEDDDGVDEPIALVGCKVLAPYAATTDYTLVAHYFFDGIKKINFFTELPSITKYRLFLPYFDFIDLDFRDYINGFEIKYYLDFSTAELCVNFYSKDSDKIIFTSSRNVGIPLSITGTDTGALRNKTMGMIAGAINVAGSIASAIPGVGNFIGSGMRSVSSTLEKSTSTISPSQTSIKNTTRNPNTGRQITTSTSSRSFSGEQSETEHSREVTTNSYRNFGSVVESAVNTLSDIANTFPTSHISNTIGDYSLWNSPLTPFIEVSEYEMAVDYNELASYCGRPARIIAQLGDLNGYVNVGMIHLGINCLHEELSEIENLLTTGVIINNPNADIIEVKPYE